MDWQCCVLRDHVPMEGDNLSRSQAVLSKKQAATKKWPSGLLMKVALGLLKFYDLRSPKADGQLLCSAGAIRRRLCFDTAC